MPYRFLLSCLLCALLTLPLLAQADKGDLVIAENGKSSAIIAV